jgi:hypothetical protein
MPFARRRRRPAGATLLLAAAAAVLAAGGASPRPARAQLLQVVFQSNAFTVTPGSTATFSGRLTNNSGGPVTVRGNSFSQLASQLTPDDTAFVNAIPSNGLTIANGSGFPLTGFTPFFDIFVSPTAVVGQTYKGTFQVQGGPNANDENLLGFQDFFLIISATPVPEPSTAGLFGAASGAAALVFFARRRTRLA